MSGFGRCALIALAVLLAGCGGDGESPVVLPPVPPVSATTVSPSESPSPSATPSAAPDSKAAERAAVEAAVRFYYDGYERAYASGDSGELARGSTEECTCRAAVGPLQKALDRGRVVGAEVEVLQVDVVSVRDGVATTSVQVRSEDGSLVDASGMKIERVRGEGRRTKAVLLSKVLGQWRVNSVLSLS